MDDLTPETLEKLMLSAFARVRGSDTVIARRGELGFDLGVVEGKACERDGGFAVTLHFFVCSGGVLRDIKEQEVYVLPPDDERIPAYLEGIALGLRALIERGDDVEVLMPHDLFPYDAFADPECRTPQDFAAAVLAPKPALRSIDLTDLTGTEPIAVNHELEAAIAEDFERLDNHLVYADWLSERGDPRGELITCSLPDVSRSARRERNRALFANKRYFAGNFMSDATWEHVQISWDRGWIEMASLRATYELLETKPNFVEHALRALLALPSSKFLRGLTLGYFDNDNAYSKLYPLLVAAGKKKTMRQLFLGDITSEEAEISWIHTGEFAELARLYPRLRDLKLRGHANVVDAMDLPDLESLVIETACLGRESVRAIAAASLPNLRRLELWLGTESRGTTATLDDLAPILAGTRLPKVVTLGLCNSEITDDLCRALPNAPLIEHVTELDLSMGTMTDAGAEALLRERERLHHLTKLSVSENFLSPGALEGLRDLGEHVTILSTYQRHDDGDRYCSVSE